MLVFKGLTKEPKIMDLGYWACWAGWAGWADWALLAVE
jgi:hypothetical protein